MHAGSRFDGPAVLLYLTFLAGLCIALSTLSCGLLCTAPGPHARGSLAALRRRISAALPWAAGGTAGGTPAAPRSGRSSSVYGEGTSRELRGLRVFTGVVRTQPTCAPPQSACHDPVQHISIAPQMLHPQVAHHVQLSPPATVLCCAAGSASGPRHGGRPGSVREYPRRRHRRRQQPCRLAGRQPAQAPPTPLGRLLTAQPPRPPAWL